MARRRVDEVDEIGLPTPSIGRAWGTDLASQRAGDLAEAVVPRARSEETVAEVLARLRDARYASTAWVYTLDGSGRLVGRTSIQRLMAADDGQTIGELANADPVRAAADDPVGAVALRAVDTVSGEVAVVDADGAFLGAIPAHRMMEILHVGHVTDRLRGAGVGIGHPHPPRLGSLSAVVRARMTWLVVGLAGSFAASWVVSRFEAQLVDEVALAFFLPLVVYMADAVGTQTETFVVRLLAWEEPPFSRTLAREAAAGLAIGTGSGLLAGLGLWAVGLAGGVAVVVASTLVASSLVATLMATIVPWLLWLTGTDPAFASGPVATVLQDIVTVGVYFGLAVAIL